MVPRKVYEDVPTAEALGLTFIGYYNALGVHRHRGRAALVRAGIAEPKADDWYPRQILFDVLKEIEQHGGQSTLFDVGKELANFTELGPDVTSFEQVIAVSSVIYPQYQRNLPAYDFIGVERDGAAWLYVFHTPWPSQAIRGFLWQMFRKFQTGALLQIDFAKGSEDDFERTFRLSWDAPAPPHRSL